jgi:hypothetical protein
MHGVANLGHHLQPVPSAQMMLFDVILERAAADELHREVRLRSEVCLRAAGFVDLRDVGMLQTAEHLGFPSEPTQQVRSGPGRLEHLQGDRAPRLILLGLVHGAHSAFADQPKNAIPADRRRTGPCGKRMFRNALQRPVLGNALSQERLNLEAQLFVTLAGPGEEGIAHGYGLLACQIIELGDFLPPAGIHGEMGEL